MRYDTIPAWGLWVRHVENISVNWVEFRSAAPDLRPAIMLDDAQDVRIDALRLPPAAEAGSVVLKNADGFSVRDSAPLADLRQEMIASEKL